MHACYFYRQLHETRIASIFVDITLTQAKVNVFSNSCYAARAKKKLLSPDHSFSTLGRGRTAYAGVYAADREPEDANAPANFQQEVRRLAGAYLVWDATRVYSI